MRRNSVILSSVIAAAIGVATYLLDAGDPSGANARHGRGEPTADASLAERMAAPERRELELSADESSPAAALNAPVAPANADAASTDEESVWQRETAGWSAADLRERANALLEEVGREALGPLEALRQAGVYEVIGHGTRGPKISYSRAHQDPLVRYEDPLDISLHSVPGTLEPDGEQRRYTLPRDRYPELYTKKRHALWMMDESSRRTAAR